MPSKKISRREFGALTAGGVLLGGSGALTNVAKGASTEAAKTAKLAPLDIAEWSFFWVGVERVTLPGGTSPVVSGKQMYVEYQVPAKVKHPFPIVLIHGGGGSGLDWMGTVDGRRGWSTMLLEEGYRVYVVDRPGHGRSPYHPDLHGGIPRGQTLESISSQFTPQRAKVPGRGGAPPAPNAKLHNQWPGTGEVGSPELFQLVASQGGSFGNGTGIIKESQVLVWQKDAAELLDKIGPAIFMTHSAGGPFGFYALEARPKLVKGIVVVEGAGGSAFAGRGSWGLINLPVEYEPPVKDPSEIKTKRVDPTPEDAKLGIGPYTLQEEPARKLKNWKDCPISIVTFGSFVCAAQSGRGGVFEASRRERGRNPPGRSWDPWQRPRDDARKEQPRGAATDSGLVEQERHDAQQGRDQAAEGGGEGLRDGVVEAGRSGLPLGRDGNEEDGLRHHPGGPDVLSVPDSAAGEVSAQHRAGAWRRRPGHALFRARRRRSWMGALFRAGRFQDVYCGSPRAGASAVVPGFAGHRSARCSPTPA